MEYYSPTKKQWNNAICSIMDGLRDYHTKLGRQRQIIIWYYLYVESKQNVRNEFIYKTETDSKTQKENW